MNYIIYYNHDMNMHIVERVSLDEESIYAIIDRLQKTNCGLNGRLGDFHGVEARSTDHALEQFFATKKTQTHQGTDFNKKINTQYN
jgi:predicted transcriptional regulator